MENNENRAIVPFNVRINKILCYAMGDTHSMNVYANLYNQIDEVYATGINWCDELLALKYLQMNEIPIYDFNIPTNINRGGVL